MVFSENEDENLELVENHLQQEAEAGFKKYVVAIDMKYVPLVDAMSIDERNELINDIISAHNDEVNEKKQNKKTLKIIVSLVIAFVLLLFTAPGVLWLINQSFTLTRNNYSEMQNNFEVLYKNKNR